MADIDEDERKLIAASIIQHNWREFLGRKRAAQGATDKSGSPESAAAAAAGDIAGLGGEGPDGERKEQSEEEVREKLLARARSLIAERDSYIAQNLSLQRQLARIFADKQAAQQSKTGGGGVNADGGEVASGGSGAANAAASAASSEAQEAKYWDAVVKVRSDRLSLDSMMEQDAKHLSLEKQDHENVAMLLNDAEREFRDVVRDHAMMLAEASLPLSITRTANSQASRLAKAKVMQQQTRRLDEFEQREDAEYAALHDTRVKFIRARNRVNALERRIKMKDNVDEDVQMIDFEQLKIENTNLNEKIEERNEDLLKLKKKATTTIHILTHVKEKLEFVKGQNAALHREVTAQDKELDQVRGALGDAKKERDFFTSENTRMREKMPLIGANNLLLDYELRKKSIEDLQYEVVSLTNEHNDLMLWIRANHSSQTATKRGAAGSTGGGTLG